jgi:hypothetical protein
MRSCLGYPDYASFKNSTGLKWSLVLIINLSISNSEDGFMVATRGTSMYVGRQAPDFNPFKNNKENEKPLKEK